MLTCYAPTQVTITQVLRVFVFAETLAGPFAPPILGFGDPAIGGCGACLPGTNRARERLTAREYRLAAARTCDC